MSIGDHLRRDFLSGEEFRKKPLFEKVKYLEYEVEVLEGDDMRSVAYLQSLNDKAQKGVEVMEQMYQPIVFHAEDMSKKLNEREKELSAIKNILRYFWEQLHTVPSKRDKLDKIKYKEENE